MEAALNINQADTQQDNEALFRMLDSGIDDMEAGRETPVEEAFEKNTELRYMYRKGGSR